METCCLDCDKDVFLRFKSPHLGDQEYPICLEHMLEFTSTPDGMTNLKTLLRGVVLRSALAPVGLAAPEEEKPAEPEDDDDWVPDT